MPAINFSAEFADRVQSGEKQQTIRRLRKRPIKAGDTLILYTGQRTKACRKLGEAACDRVFPVVIGRKSMGWRGYSLNPYSMTANFLAQNDGFESYAAMADWFDNRYGLPFEGVVIQWTLSEEASDG